MKKFFCAALFAGIIFGQTLSAQQTQPKAQAPAAQAQPAAQTASAQPPLNYTWSGSMPGLGILRGVFSVVQSPAELVRGETLRFSNVPYSDHSLFVHYPFVFAAGLGHGFCYTAVRILCGVGDILTLGFLSPYSPDFPPFIWESPWTK